MAKFDLYQDNKVVQSGVDSPIEIAGLTPDTQYDNYALTYAGESAKTALSFHTDKLPVEPTTTTTTQKPVEPTTTTTTVPA